MQQVTLDKVTRWDILSYDYNISVPTLMRLNPNYLDCWELTPGITLNIPENDRLELSRTSRNLLESKKLYTY